MLAQREAQLDHPLTEDIGIAIHQTSISSDFALRAEEAFFASTSLCICPVISPNQKNYPSPVPGPVTARITEAFAELVGFNFVAQYLAFSGGEDTGIGL